LTEHVHLAIEVMRQAVHGDLRQDSLAELTRNTDELTFTVGVVYGPEGAAAFDELRTTHIEFFNDCAASWAAQQLEASRLICGGLGGRVTEPRHASGGRRCPSAARNPE